MSRYSGCWVGMKVITETVETTAEIDLHRRDDASSFPVISRMPPGGTQSGAGLTTVSSRPALAGLQHGYRGDRLCPRQQGQPHHDGLAGNARYGTAGLRQRATEDIRQGGAMARVGDHRGDRRKDRFAPLQDRHALPPLELEGVHQFEQVGLEEIFIVEERREIAENQVNARCCSTGATTVRPRIVGKMDEHDKRFLTFAAERQRLLAVLPPTGAPASPRSQPRNQAACFAPRPIGSNGREATQVRQGGPRHPHAVFLLGLPAQHLDQGPGKAAAPSPALVGHYGARWMDCSTETFTHMGGEGVPWVGVAPFTKEQHVFANLGDGTYFHSGSLAIRQSVASGANITYKLLYNDATAMTGGQQVDGELSPQQVTQMHAEGTATSIWSFVKPQGHPAALHCARRHHPPSRRTRCRDEGMPSAEGHLRHRIRADLRGREALAPQARLDGRPGAPRHDQSGRLREGCGDCSVQSNLPEPWSSCWRRSLAASAPSTSRPATRTTRA